jgi:hypothetical protein
MSSTGEGRGRVALALGVLAFLGGIAARLLVALVAPESRMSDVAVVRPGFGESICIDSPPGERPIRVRIKQGADPSSTRESPPATSSTPAGRASEVAERRDAPEIYDSEYELQYAMFRKAGLERDYRKAVDRFPQRPLALSMSAARRLRADDWILAEESRRETAARWTSLNTRFPPEPRLGRDVEFIAFPADGGLESVLVRPFGVCSLDIAAFVSMKLRGVRRGATLSTEDEQAIESFDRDWRDRLEDARRATLAAIWSEARRQDGDPDPIVVVRSGRAYVVPRGNDHDLDFAVDEYDAEFRRIRAVLGEPAAK